MWDFFFGYYKNNIDKNHNHANLDLFLWCIFNFLTNEFTEEGNVILKYLQLFYRNIIVY